MSGEIEIRKSSVEDETGQVLRDNNEEIVKYINWLKRQRRDFDFLIDRQVTEKAKIESEIETLTFKLTQLCRSMNQRIIARSGYEKTISDIEAQYAALVAASGVLLSNVTVVAKELEDIMDKNVGTSQDLTPHVHLNEPEAQGGERENPPAPVTKPVSDFRKYVNHELGDNDLDPEPAAELDASQLVLIDRLFGEEGRPKEERKSDAFEIKPPQIMSDLSMMTNTLEQSVSSRGSTATLTSSLGKSKTQSSAERRITSNDTSVSIFGEAYSRQHSSATPLTAADKKRQASKQTNNKK